MNISAIVSGIALIIIGIFLTLVIEPFSIANIFIGIIPIIIGIVILFNSEKEDKIEQIKHRK